MTWSMAGDSHRWLLRVAGVLVVLFVGHGIVMSANPHSPSARAASAAIAICDGDFEEVHDTSPACVGIGCGTAGHAVTSDTHWQSKPDFQHLDNGGSDLGAAMLRHLATGPSGPDQQHPPSPRIPRAFLQVYLN